MFRSLLMAGAATLALNATASAGNTPIPNWTGFYLGGQVGGGWAATQTTFVTATNAFPAGYVGPQTRENGFLGGLYGGYNYQIDHLVFGIDGDYTWARLNGSGSDIGPSNGDLNTFQDHFNWIATTTGRLGYAFDKLLVFGKAGWAWAGFDHNASTFNPAGKNVSNGVASFTKDGFTVGTGLEYALADHWSAKLEYDYIKFQTTNFTETDTITATGAVVPFPRTQTGNMSIVKLGAAYRF
jgi:outer membrane immunogenic protein